MKSFIEACQQLSNHEYRALILGRWGKSRITYSFDIDLLTDEMRKKIYLAEGYSVVVSALSQAAQQIMQSVFDGWVQTCDRHLSFESWNEKAAVEVPNLIIVACDNFQPKDGFVTTGMTFLNYKSGGYNLLFSQLVVCLPPDLTLASNLHTAYHEVGHGIGLRHPHEVESVRRHLQQINEGQGCSVLSYPHNISSEHSICQKQLNCKGTSYAVTPGPLDIEMCRRLYSDDSWKALFDEQAALVYEAKGQLLNTAKNGLVRGAVDGLIFSLLDTLCFEKKSGVEKKSLYIFGMLLLHMFYVCTQLAEPLEAVVFYAMALLPLFKSVTQEYQQYFKYARMLMLAQAFVFQAILAPSKNVFLFNMLLGVAGNVVGFQCGCFLGGLVIQPTIKQKLIEAGLFDSRVSSVEEPEPPLQGYELC